MAVVLVRVREGGASRRHRGAGSRLQHHRQRPPVPSPTAFLHTTARESRGTKSSPPPSPATPGFDRRPPRGATSGGGGEVGAAAGWLGFCPPRPPRGATRGAGLCWFLKLISYRNRSPHSDLRSINKNVLKAPLGCAFISQNPGVELRTSTSQ